MTTRELLAAKAEAKAKAVAILNSVQTSARKMSAEENAEFDRLTNEVTRLEELISKNALVASWTGESAPAARPSLANGNPDRLAIAATKEYSEAFYAYARNGVYTKPEFMATLNEASGAAGSYLIPVSLDTLLIQKAAATSCMRQVAKIITTSNDRDIPIEDTVADAAWTAEEAPVHETVPTFTKTTLKAYKASALVKVSNELLNDSAFSIEAELASQFGKAFGKLTEDKYVNGSGTGEPQGVINCTVGENTTGGSITGDSMMNLFHSVKPAYRADGTFVMNDSTMLKIRKIKAVVSGDYLLVPGLANGQSDTLLGRADRIFGLDADCGSFACLRRVRRFRRRHHDRRPHPSDVSAADRAVRWQRSDRIPFDVQDGQPSDEPRSTAIAAVVLLNLRGAFGEPAGAPR